MAARQAPVFGHGGHNKTEEIDRRVRAGFEEEAVPELSFQR